jgi:hypothetical protein
MPGAVDATLAGWRAIGFTCDPPRIGQPDNLPQWHCRATLSGVGIDAEVLGQGGVIHEVTVSIDPTDPESARKLAVEVIDGTAAADPIRQDLSRWIQDWDGREAVAEFRSTRAVLQGLSGTLLLEVYPGAG